MSPSVVDLSRGGAAAAARGRPEVVRVEAVVAVVDGEAAADLDVDDFCAATHDRRPPAVVIIVGRQTGAVERIVFGPKRTDVHRPLRSPARGSVPPLWLDLAEEAATSDGRVRLDIRRRVLTVGERPVPLTPREFHLLAHMMTNPGAAVPAAELLRQVWGLRASDTTTVRMHIRQLRQKVEIDPSQPRLLVTVRGLGYRFDA